MYREEEKDCIQYNTTRHDTTPLFYFHDIKLCTGNSPVDYNFPISPRNGQGLKYRIIVGEPPHHFGKRLQCIKR